MNGLNNRNSPEGDSVCSNKMKVIVRVPEERPVIRSNTYSQIYIHIVFAVQGRHSFIAEQNREELQKYMSGIILKRSQKLLAIYCVPDHVHLLIGMKPNMPVSDLVRDIKSASSHFISESKKLRGKFNWQEGFGAFSYSRSQISDVIHYISNQKEHHKKRSFREEYLDFLKKFEIEFQDKYLFEWYD
jgi:putative transposase